MCTYQTERVNLRGSGKSRLGWMKVTDATVYFDHPVHFSAGHALMIDVTNPSKGPDARIALELDPASARALADAILLTLNQAPTRLLTEFVSP
ncbi:MAG: DUF6295 family protein [Acidimicrobiales bacterium]